MGNENDKVNQTGELAVAINHPRFQNARLLSEGRDKSLQVSMGVDQKEYDRWLAASTKANLNSDFLLSPKRKDFSRKGFCGDSGTLKLWFENYSYLLTEEIYNRSGKKSKFEQWQLWFLLLGLINAHQEVKKRTGGRVGDIRPHNIFLNAQGDFRVAHSLSWPRQSSNFSKAFDHQRTYLAPEDMVRLQMGTNQDSAAFSSEIFSIGFTVLSAAMLEDFLRLYNLKNYKFDTAEAATLLDQWKSNTVYSEIFTALVSNLCNFQPEKRLDGDELWNWISKYESPIRTKEDFVIEEAPLKVEQEIEDIRRQFPDEQPILYQPPPQYPHPFTDKSVVQSYIPPNQHFLPQPTFLPPRYPQEAHQLPSPRPPIPNIQNERIYIEQGPIPTRMQSTSPYRASQGIQEGYGGYASQQVPQAPQGFPAQGQVVGRPLQEHELPPEVRKALQEKGFFGGQGSVRQMSEGQTQLPPQFVGRTVNETYLSPRGVNPNTNTGNLSYFQGVIDPQGTRGGRIEQTVYIQRPQEYH